MTFILPYNFVRMQPIPRRNKIKPTSHGNPGDVSNLYSGRLKCRIIAISPMFIPDMADKNVKSIILRGLKQPYPKQFKSFFNVDGKTPVIPSTTLKGAFRAVAEALSNGCMSTFDGKYGKERFYLADESLNACSKYDALCSTCRIFGMSTGDKNKENEESKYYKAKITISDGVLLSEPNYLDPVTLPVMLSPHPDGAVDVYSDEEGNARGQKFYYHRDDLQIMQSKYGWKTLDAAIHNNWTGDIKKTNWQYRSTVTPLDVGSIFEFTVDYQNMTQDELALLINAIELRSNLLDTNGQPININDSDEVNFDFQVGEGVYHKFGYGKPAGLGSSACYIVDWQELDQGDRYGVSVPENGGWKKKTNARTEIEKIKAGFHEQHSENTSYQDLLAILRYPNNIPEIRHISGDTEPAIEHFPPIPGSELEWLEQKRVENNG